jgi:hypothetical protein
LPTGKILEDAICGSNSVVECDLAKVEVASSNLVSRSTHAEHENDQETASILPVSLSFLADFLTLSGV